MAKGGGGSQSTRNSFEKNRFCGMFALVLERNKIARMC